MKFGVSNLKDDRAMRIFNDILDFCCMILMKFYGMRNCIGLYRTTEWSNLIELTRKMIQLYIFELCLLIQYVDQTLENWKFYSNLWQHQILWI